MTSRSVLHRGRRRVETLFLDSCRITKPGTGPTGFDEATGQNTPPPRVTVYEGPCRIQVKSDINSNVVETTSGEHEFTYLTATLQLPIAGTELVRPDNISEILACVDDPTMVGRLWNVQGVYHKSQATHRRFRIREVIA